MPLELSLLGTLVQTVGAVLLALIFFYLSRGSGSRVLKAAGWAWLFLFLALAALIAAVNTPSPSSSFPIQYFKLLYLAALIVAADRIDHDLPDHETDRPRRPFAAVSVALGLASPARARCPMRSTWRSASSPGSSSRS